MCAFFICFQLGLSERASWNEISGGIDSLRFEFFLIFGAAFMSLAIKLYRSALKIVKQRIRNEIFTIK